MKFFNRHYFDKRIRVQVFSVTQSNYRQVEFGWGKVLLLSMLAGFAFALIVSGLILAFTSVYKGHSVHAFSQENTVLHEKITEMESRFSTISSQIGILEDVSHKMEVIPEILDTTSSQPLIDSERNVYLAYTSSDTPGDSLQIDIMLDNLERRVQEALSLQELVGDQFAQVEKELQHLPTIRPLAHGRISDLFGKRRDPFIKKIRHHNGIDISSPKGTDVYAPASGIVELVKTRYTLNRGYGRVVIINHGNGIKTLYGHLNKVFVKAGQKVERWDVIGQVGETGRATGPHLHYEVWENGKAIDPMEYILN